MRLNNLAMENLPEDLVINYNVCRGNYHSHGLPPVDMPPLPPIYLEKKMFLLITWNLMMSVREISNPFIMWMEISR